VAPLAVDRELREVIRAGPGICVLTGGQTGVDTEAALAALRAGLVTHLVFPHGYLQEDGPITPSRRDRLRGALMRELSLAEFRYRTWTCVYLSDAVVLLDPAGGDGCRETARAAESLGRPLLIPGSAVSREPVSSQRIAAWLRHTGARVLMVAGCRGSLLAAAGLREEVRRQAGVIVAGARQRHDQLISKSFEH
jgi:hypothetical protein